LLRRLQRNLDARREQTSTARASQSTE
jgi:hypothetical protein